MRRNVLVTPLAVTLAVGASGMASAQDLTSAVLTGTVTGPNGRPLQGVRVYLTSPTLLTPRDGRTSDSGTFRFSLLPPGRYTVTYSLDGHISRKAEMTLIAGNVSNGSVSLRAMDVATETIEIVAEVSNVVVADKTDTVVQTAFTTDRLEEIGGGRGIAALQDLTPGINGSLLGRSEGGQNGFNIRGSLNRGNKFMQDGQMVGDALLGIFYDGGSTVEDLIESVAVIQSPLNAKLGNTDGGIISITTKRGGNTFSGSLRYSGIRGSNSYNLWQAQRVNYPDARGYAGSPGVSGDDQFTRSWQYSILGPIIPNYLTFALGGNITPTVYDSALMRSRNNWAAATWGQNSNAWGYNPQLTRVGTFYMNNDPDSPNYGDVVRKANWGAMSDPDAMVYDVTTSGNNTVNLYLQITPNHQLSYYYMQGNTFQNLQTNSRMIDTSMEYGLDTFIKAWNISYRAVIGAAGIFDVRYGRSQNFRDYPKAGKETVNMKYYYSYWTVDSPPSPSLLGSAPGSSFEDFFQFYASGMIDNAWNANMASPWSQYYSSGTNRPSTSPLALGLDAAGSDGSGVNSMNANYQHMLDYKGSHIIDIGFNMEQADANGIPTGARYFASPVGQIAPDLVASQVGNVRGKTPSSPYMYQGKYIVFDVRNSFISDIEPHALRNRFQTGDVVGSGILTGPMLLDGLVWDMEANNVNSQLIGRMNVDNLPYMREYWGSDVGDMLTTNTSYYINDMWTINENHSLMLGLRADGFELNDSVRTVHSYIKVTPRLEYKYDIFGDQKHLFSGSFAQFHQMAAMQTYWPFIQKKWGNRSNRLWTGDEVDGSKKQRGYYLVDLDDILNPRNYTIEYDSSLSGGEFGDVDKGFKPPTSTEISLWYRRTFSNGGYIKVSFNNRTWSDLYDYFPSEVFEWTNPNTGSKSNRIKTTLKNTDDFTRTYNGLELQWDFPITKKVVFGGSYTFSSFKHNQTGVGSSSTYIDGAQTNDNLPTLQTPWWFDEAFSRDVVIDGNVVWSPNGRSTWSPMEQIGNEFNLNYYLMVYMTQGRARSNFTLRGTYTGSSVRYDRVTVRVGRAIIPGYADFPGQGVAGLSDSASVAFGEYTLYDSFANHLTYNLNMPLTRNLSWFVNINVTNVFNHIPRQTQVPSWGAIANTTLTPWAYQNNAAGAMTASNWSNAAIGNPFRDGWTRNIGDVSSFFTTRDLKFRAITMQTGIRF